MNRNVKSTAIIGATGEFYVASFLSSLGFIVALPRGGVPSSDLLVTNTNCNKTITLQVKTATKPLDKIKKYGEYLTWTVSKKSINIQESSHWYVFVDLNAWPGRENPPDIYFVPSCDVVNLLKTDWNNKNAKMLFYPIFKQINEENEQYTINKQNTDFYKGIVGFRDLEHFLNNPQPDNEADGKYRCVLE